MNGKWVAGGLVLTGVIGGIVLYWLQVYAYYDDVAFTPGAEISLVPVTGGAPQPLLVDDIQGIDGSNSPLRFRACHRRTPRACRIGRLWIGFIAVLWRDPAAP